MSRGYGHADAQATALRLIDGAVQTQSLVVACETAFLVPGTVFVLVPPPGGRGAVRGSDTAAHRITVT